MSSVKKNVTVMVVDDMEPIRSVLTKMLSQWGYRVVAYSEAMSSIQAALADPPDLFLLDINMPGMDGFEMCRSLKKDKKLKDIPVIFISVLDEAMDKVKAFGSGAVDYITKPFQMEEVFARVTTHIKLQQYRKHLEAQVQAQSGEEVDFSEAPLPVDTQINMPLYTQESENVIETGKNIIYRLRGDLEDMKSLVRLCNNLGETGNEKQVQLIRTLCSSVDYTKLTEHFDQLLMDMEELMMNIHRTT